MNFPNSSEQAHSSSEARLQTLERLLAIQSATLATALTEASNVMAETFRSDKIDVFLFDASKESLIAVGTSQTPMGVRQRQLGLEWLPLANGGRTAEVFQTGQPYLHGRVDEDLEELRGIRESLGIRSMMVVPLDIGGTRRGAIAASSAQPDHFSPDVLRFLQIVAHWVSMLIQRADLVEQLTREATENARRVVAEELVTVLAHDLGNYLTPLIGRLYLFRTRAESENRAADIRDANEISQGLLRIKGLIDDLLDVSRIDQGLFSVVRRTVDLATLLRSTASVFQAEPLHVVVEGSPVVLADVDAERIRQALENLISNAYRYAPGTPPTLTLRQEQREDGSWAVFAVQDRGPGIAPELLPRLMERYGRGRRSSGLGLGLYLARRIAEAHGGALTVDTALGRGTTFNLAVPLLSTGGLGTS